MRIWWLITYFIFFLNLFSVEHCIAQRDYFKAEQHYKNYEFELAIPFYLKALSIDSSLESIEQLAYCYRQTHNYKEALKYYEKALEIPYYTAVSVFYYGEMLQQLGRYEEAIDQFELYKIYEITTTDFVERYIASCKFAKEALNNKLNVTIENCKEVNTKFSESGMFVGKKVIYFSSDKKNSSTILIDSWTGNSFQKIYTIPYQLKNDKITFQKAKPFNQTINSGYHAFFPSFNNKESKLYFTSTSLEDNPRKNYQVKATEFVNSMNITSASLMGKRWVIDSNLKSTENFQYSMLHPCLNTEGTRIYFASDMPGGYGSYDLYYCEIDVTGNLSKPINLGSKINTVGIEAFPSYATNDILYFSSKGLLGFGGLDIFKATINNNEILKIENMGNPINSSYDDYSYFPIEDSDWAFICSDRIGGKGKDDIYKIKWLK